MFVSRLTMLTTGAVKAAAAADGGEYWIHQQIWRLFECGEGEKRPFLYRRDDEAGGPICLMVSEEMPVADPDLWTVESKPYAPRLAEGERLLFMLRANPVVTRRLGQERRHARHDVVMDAKRRVEEGGGSISSQAELMQRAGTEWLTRKGEAHGFVLDAESMRVERYRQLRIGGRRRSPIRLSTLDFQGALEVCDVAAFTDALYQGIGSAKGFGCGLLMVRRA